MFTEKDVTDLIELALDTAFKMFHTKQYEAAETILLQTFKVDPENYRATQLMGLTKHHSGQYSDAIKYFKQAISINASDSENYNNIGLCYCQLGEYAESISCIQKAIELSPDCSYLYSNLGLQYRHIQEIDKAIDSFKKSLELSNDETTWGMLGGCYGEKKDLENAEKSFLKAIEINPEFAGAHVDLSSVYQLKGQWEKSWPEYAWRTEIYDQLKFWKAIYIPEKIWTGQPLDGKTIIVHAEQGHGDVIHFFRYIKYLKGKVILHCADVLKPLFEKDVDEVFTMDPVICAQNKEKIPEHDYHCSIINLPMHLGNPPIPTEPYLKTDSMNLENYSDYFKIGVVWAGNPQHPNDCYRSCYLTQFKEIQKISNVKLFSLMKDTRPRIYRLSKIPIDLTQGSEDMRLVDMSPLMNNFEDTAKIINAMDLIITVDTAVLHLAGALGKETWGLISWNCDWRWTIDGENTVWYPSVKLFRQPEKGDWNSVFSTVENELKKRLKVC